MTVRKAFSVALALAMLAGAHGPVHAQSNEPDPSLKGFRLDPVPSQPRQTGPQTSESTSPTTSTQTPQPRQQQPVTAPPVQPTVTQPAASAPAPRNSATKPVERAPATTPSARPTAATGPAASSSATPATTPAPAETDTAADTVPATATPATDDAGTPADDTASATNWSAWGIGAALAALLAAAAAWYWRRRTRRATASIEAGNIKTADRPVLPDTQPAEPAIDPVAPATASETTLLPPSEAATSATPAYPRQPIARPVSQPALRGTITARAPVLPYASEARAQLVVEYLPARADIGTDNLMVAGRMRVTNIGNAPARAMQLRLALTSASAQQDQVVASFHADTEHFAARAIGDLDPGKSLDMDVELGIALKDLQSFTINGQKLFVPMLLANVGYAWDARDGADKAEFACLIGRESSPPQEKMGPLRLDLGPRSFAGLGQRALAA